MESTQPSTSSQSPSTSYSHDKQHKRIAGNTQGMTSDSPDESRPLKKMKISQATDMMLPLSKDQVRPVFNKIFADGKVHNLTVNDISVDKKPRWFKSRWVWKAISIFDNSIRDASEKQSKKQSLKQLLNTTSNRDPYLNLVIKQSVLQALRLSEESSGIDIKSKVVVKFWLRYTFASEGFDLDNEWLDGWLSEQDTPIDADSRLLFKFSETDDRPSSIKNLDTEALFVGLEKKDLFINKKPESLNQSLWDLLHDLTYYLRECLTNGLKPLSETGSQKHKELHILRDILFLFFAGIGVCKLMQTSMAPAAGSEEIAYDESSWHRLQMEMLLDRVALKHYPDFKGWRDWLRDYRRSLQK